MKRKPYVRVSVTIFVVIYVAAMMLATTLEKKSQDYISYRFRSNDLEMIDFGMEPILDGAWKGETYSEEYIQDYILNAVMSIECWDDDTSRKTAVAVYKENGEKVTQSQNVLEIIVGSTYSFELDEYFNEEEQAFLKQVYLDREADRKGISAGEEKPPYWRVHAYVNEETRELAKLYFTTDYNWEVTEEDYESPNTETKWSWINPDE